MGLCRGGASIRYGNLLDHGGSSIPDSEALQHELLQSMPRVLYVIKGSYTALKPEGGLGVGLRESINNFFTTLLCKENGTYQTDPIVK